MNNFISQNKEAFKKKKKRWQPKGRQIENNIFNEIQKLFTNKNILRDELIEYLHLTNLIEGENMKMVEHELITASHALGRVFKLIKDSLEQIGFICFEAENGIQALALIKQTALSLVIADVNMPEKNGLELLNDIRSDENMCDLPVILTMLEPFEDIITNGKELLMNDYLVKPFDVFMLSKTLDKVIKTTGGESL